MTESDRRRIIVVDDDPAAQQLLQRRLERAGYEVRTCANGQEALRPITELGAKIVVTDLDMPGLDGLGLCRAVRELERIQALTNVYIILVTAHHEKDKVVEGLEAGANDYLTKPFHAREFLARIQVGERMLRLQEELFHRTVELQKVNAEMAVLAARLDRLANTDTLTQLANRRALFARLDEIWSTMSVGGDLSCIMIDIDHFKRVNDTYGHAAGDEVLQSVAGAIRENVTRPELCGRFGGEEFLIVLPATALEPAAEVAERLRHTIAARPIRCAEFAIPVTISCGVAGRGSCAASTEVMLRDADAMLYQAKAHGRNQTWLFDEGGGRPFATECGAAMR